MAYLDKATMPEVQVASSPKPPERTQNWIKVGGKVRGHRRVAEPDWATVHRELKRKHATLTILWDEYIAANPGGYSYSRFCDL